MEIPSRSDASQSTVRFALGAVALSGLIVLRSPGLLAHPRFWAEEGVLYFAYAYRNGFWTSLIQAQAGYFNLTANLAGALATLVPLQWAPTVTIAIAFLVQLATALVAFTSSSPLVRTERARWLVGTAVLLLAPAEVWLTTIAAHFWLAIAAFFLLVETEPRRAARAWVARVVLAFGALSAGVTCFLAPLFAWRAFRRRDSDARWQAGIVAAGCVVQGIAVVNSMAAGDTYERFHSSRILGFSGLSWIQELGSLFLGYDRFLNGPFTPFAAFASVCVVTVAVLVASTSPRAAGVAWLSALVIGVPSVALAIKMIPDARYVFAPAVMVFTGVVMVAGGSGWRRAPAIALVLLTVASTAGSYWKRAVHSDQWPPWRWQVSQWDGKSPLWIPPPMKTGDILLRLQRE